MSTTNQQTFTVTEIAARWGWSRRRLLARIKRLVGSGAITPAMRGNRYILTTDEAAIVAQGMTLGRPRDNAKRVEKAAKLLAGIRVDAALLTQLVVREQEKQGEQ